MTQATLRLGTCSWTAKGWAQVFYSPGCDRAHYLREYAQHYDTVEVDSTFYGLPRAQRGPCDYRPPAHDRTRGGT
jgi:uncharacterized protein YecE (DUF72 family)